MVPGVSGHNYFVEYFLKKHVPTSRGRLKAEDGDVWELIDVTILIG
jgi:hypothetical protein